MRIIISIDDTDQLSTKGVKGTGDVAQGIAKGIADRQWGTISRITRHQLLLHPDIPYTSHNSAMCFEAHLREEALLSDLVSFCGQYLESESEPEADPGLCVAVVERLVQPERLIEFGYMTKSQVMTKDAAYALAHELGIHLSEHGGTGQGIIGALAGAGLRLGGNDGAFKNKHKVGEAGQELTAGELRTLASVDGIKSAEGVLLDDGETVVLGGMVKSILSEGIAVIPVQRLDTGDGPVKWTTCSREQIHRQQGGGRK